MPRLSGLQKAVLALYRQCLRTARTKPEHSRPHFQSFARKEFDKNIHLDKKDFSAIEFFLRKGTRQLETHCNLHILKLVPELADTAELLTVQRCKLPDILPAVGDRTSPVKVAAQMTALAITKAINPNAVKVVVPRLMHSIRNAQKWAEKMIDSL